MLSNLLFQTKMNAKNGDSAISYVKTVLEDMNVHARLVTSAKTEPRAWPIHQ